MVGWLVWLLLNAHMHRSILEAADHIILISANQLMVIGLKIWSLSNPGFEPGVVRSLAQRAYHGPGTGRELRQNGREVKKEVSGSCH
jgi:hypothetical protein